MGLFNRLFGRITHLKVFKKKIAEDYLRVLCVYIISGVPSAYIIIALAVRASTTPTRPVY